MSELTVNEITSVDGRSVDFPDGIAINGANLGTASTRDVGTAAGDVMEVGAGGWLAREGLKASSPNSVSVTTLRRRNDGAVVPSWIAGDHYTTIINMPTQSIPIQSALVYVHDLRKWYFTYTVTGDANTPDKNLINPKEFLTEVNTTVDGSGFIKSASPIVKLYSDKIELNDYKEIENCTFERVGTGHYIIKGAPLLSRDGWYIETLKDRNNNIYFTLDYEELEDGLHIRTYEPDYSTGRATNGAPVDINEGRFVTLRFEEDPSLYPTPEEAEESVK